MGNVAVSRYRNFQSLHLCIATRHDFSGRRGEDVHLFIVDLRLAQTQLRVRRWRRWPQKLLFRRAVRVCLFVLRHGRLEAPAFLQVVVRGINPLRNTLRLVICAVRH